MFYWWNAGPSLQTTYNDDSQTFYGDNMNSQFQQQGLYYNYGTPYESQLQTHQDFNPTITNSNQMT